MAIQITATADVEHVVKALGEAMATRVRRRAVNEIGKDLRRRLPAVLAAEVPTTRRALHPRGRGASPGQADPFYTLRLNRRIKIAELKAKSRRFKRTRRGSPLGRLALDVPAGGGRRKVLQFRRVQQIGRGIFKLLEAGPLPARAVGGVTLRRDLSSTPGAREVVDRAGPALQGAVAEGIMAAITRRRARRRARR